MAKKKRKLSDGAATQPEPDAAAVEEDEDEPKGDSNSKSAAAPTAEERLAAFGEAFMSSINRAPPKPKAAPPPRAADPFKSAPAALEAALERKVGAPGLPGEGKKRRRNKSKKARLEKLALQGKSGSGDTPSTGGAASAAAPSGAPKLEARLFGLPAASVAPDPRSKPPQLSARDRRNFMSGKVSSIRMQKSEEDVQGGSKKRGGERTAEDAEFQKTLRDVLHYVTPLLGKRERQQYEDSKIRALGGKIEKQKMPYRRFQEEIKINKQKRERLVEEDKLAGVEMSANAYKASWVVDSVLKKKKEALKDKKKRREDGFLRLGLGARERGGMATIPKAAIKNMQRGSKII